LATTLDYDISWMSELPSLIQHTLEILRVPTFFAVMILKFEFSVELRTVKSLAAILASNDHIISCIHHEPPCTRVRRRLNLCRTFWRRLLPLRDVDLLPELL